MKDSTIWVGIDDHADSLKMSVLDWVVTSLSSGLSLYPTNGV